MFAIELDSAPVLGVRKNTVATYRLRVVLNSLFKAHHAHDTGYFATQQMRSICLWFIQYPCQSFFGLVALYTQQEKYLSQPFLMISIVEDRKQVIDKHIFAL